MGKITVLLKILLTNTTSDCSFVNLSPIFTFSILVNNDIVDMSHGIGCNGTHFSGKLCVTIDQIGHVI